MNKVFNINNSNIDRQNIFMSKYIYFNEIYPSIDLF